MKRLLTELPRENCCLCQKLFSPEVEVLMEMHKSQKALSGKAMFLLKNWPR